MWCEHQSKNRIMERRNEKTLMLDQKLLYHVPYNSYEALFMRVYCCATFSAAAFYRHFFRCNAKIVKKIFITFNDMYSVL